MTIDLKELRELAEKATPGPWAISEHPDGACLYIDGRDTKFGYVAVAYNGNKVGRNEVNDYVQNAAFIAANNPAATVALLDLIDELAGALQQSKARVLDFCEVSDLMPDSTAELLNDIDATLARYREAGGQK